MNLTRATVNSVNTVYAQLVMDIGAQPVVDLAAKMGVRSPQAAVPSAALGSNGVTVLDMASAYGTLAGDGMHTEPMLVTQGRRRDGTVLWRRLHQQRELSSENDRRTINGPPTGGGARYRGERADRRPVAGKTGTGDEWADAWFVGYTPELVTAVWVGFPTTGITMRRPTRITVTGGTWPAQIWQLFAGAALAEKPATPFPSRTSAPTRRRPTVDPRDGPRCIRCWGCRWPTPPGAAPDRRLHGSARHPRPSRDVSRPDTVIAQSPAVGGPDAPGATVTITVANGPRSVLIVPAVSASSADRCGSTRTRRGFEVRIVVRGRAAAGEPGAPGGGMEAVPLQPATDDEAIHGDELT